MLLALAACGSAEERVLRVSTDVWPGYETLYVARDLGYYDGTQVRVVELPTATDAMEALRSGRLEVAALTLDEALSLMADGFRLRAIMVFDYSNGGDAVVAKPGITSLAQLRGRRVAAERLAVGGLMLQSALDAANLTLSDIQLVDCGRYSRIECYKARDAIVTFEPSKTLLLENGAQLLWDSSHIPHRIVDILVTPVAVAESRPRGLRDLVAGYFAARKYFEENRDDALRRMAAREHVSAGQFDGSLNGVDILSLAENRSILGSEPAPLEVMARKLGAYMRSRGMLSKAIDLENFASPQFLPEEIH